MIIDTTRDCQNCYCHLVCAIYNPHFDNYAPECNLYMGKEDYEKVKHGKWLTTDAYPHRVYCSLCFKNYVTNEEIILERAKEPHPIFCTEAEYCPHCGAKMDGKDEI